jgi:PIN domain nuclease of toxin-antitoxin system
MRLLVDTHCWLWMQTAPERFSAPALALLVDTNNELLLSAASAWEIAIKFALGKLPLPAPPQDYVPSRMLTSGTKGLPVQHAHALRVAELPPHHGDPFDRLLVAQAQVEQIPIMTADPLFRRYAVEILEA